MLPLFAGFFQACVTNGRLSSRLCISLLLHYISSYVFDQQAHYLRMTGVAETHLTPPVPSPALYAQQSRPTRIAAVQSKNTFM